MDIFASSKEVITQIISETVIEYREQPAENFVQQFPSQFVIESKTEVLKTPKCSTKGLRNLHEFTYYREKAGEKLAAAYGSKHFNVDLYYLTGFFSDTIECVRKAEELKYTFSVIFVAIYCRKQAS